MNSSRFAFFAALAMLAPTARAVAAVSVTELRCEGLRAAEQVDTPTPRFSWQLDSNEHDVRQTAYQLRLTDLSSGPTATPVESPRIESTQTQWVSFPGFVAKPRSSYAWQVRIWDHRGATSEWSTPQRFHTGLIAEKWPADWIGDGRLLGLHQTAPARHFRHTFKLERAPVRARLFVSAFGLVEPWLNGRPVTEDRFVPGWPDYRNRLFYAAYDVTSLVRAGENVWGMILGDGWYSGSMLPHHQYGPEAKFSAFIDVTDENGKVATLTTGKEWRWTEDGPITMNSIYHGETYDARREQPDWCTPAGNSSWNWRDVTLRTTRNVTQSYTARLSPPVRRIETLKPVSVRQVEPGVFLYDLGQNMVGWPRLRITAPAGREITVRSSEMLGPDQRLFTANLRRARATLHYTAKGANLEEWEPRFSYFGFRYVELSGVEAPLENAIEGVVVHSDLPRTGTFECSDADLNQLYRNALWSQKGNFLELPTDCPQRDERLGWTGDAQVFAPTALYNLDAGTFYRQWLFTLRDSFRDGPHGGYPDVAPYTGFGFGSPGWAEAGIIIPWVTYLHTGDRELLAENLPTIQHAIELMAAQSPDGIRRCRLAWGDWLAPGFATYKSPPRQDLIATACYAHAADLAANIADALDRPELAAMNRALRDKARAAYQREYIAPDGRVADDVQTSYLLTLAFDLAPVELRPKIVEHLIRTFTEKDNHLATGFLGTPLITPVLTSVGRADLAYTVLRQKTYPSWLFTVRNGATTIWERWDSWTPEQGFHREGMNSFNHYAYGAVVSWFYDTIAGLQPLPDAPGWSRFRIAPIPGGGLTFARATLHTPHGVAASDWKITDGWLHLSVRIPPNTRAEVIVPAAAADIPLDDPILSAALARKDPNRTTFTLPSGTYTFRAKYRR